MDATELARRFGLDGAVTLSDGPVARGKQGEVWRLETPDGRWAVKAPFQPVGEDDVRESTLFQETAYACGVPTPAVRRTDDGRVFATVSGRRVRLYGWVDVLAPDPMLDPGLVGDVVGQLHQVPTTATSTDVAAWHRAPVGPARWDELVTELRAAGAPFAERLADLRDELVALESWLEPPQDVRLCHCDLWADNVLATADGGVCVLDWENSGPADPSQELACVLFEFGRSDAGRARALAEAYREAGGPGRVDRRGRFSMLIAQLGHITEIAATDWLQPNRRSPDRAAAAAWISEVFDEPHTRDALDELLGWVT
ncbi:phosphotransferase enzyme family protein [Angustibacter luteus]|uniref:Phosphotransferase enzyme family protein n=1 Tax=Angustibacter luteus TaxID=658456 RepID=A0ABW1JKY9_9ACTN